MDPGTLAFLLVVWILKNAAMDVTHAVKGTPNPRYRAKAARARTAGRQPAAQPRYGGRDYWADFWSDVLSHRTELRREDAARKRAARIEADRVIDEPHRGPLPWEGGAPVRPTRPPPRPAPTTNPPAMPATDAPDHPPGGCTATSFISQQHTYQFNASVGPARPGDHHEMCGRANTDPIHRYPGAANPPPTAPPAEDRRPATNPARPTVQPDPPPPASDATDHPSATVIPFPRHYSEEPTVSVSNGEVIGLSQSIAYAKGLAASAAEHSPAGNEGYVGHLLTSKVTGAGLSTAHDMQEAFGTAMAAADRHAIELERQLAVQESYDMVPDAGDKGFQQNGR